MNWDYYFIFDRNGTKQTLHCICKTTADANQALEDCYLDNKYNTDIIKQISFCLIVTIDNTTDNYELNKRATEELLRNCQVVNNVRI